MLKKKREQANISTNLPFQSVPGGPNFALKLHSSNRVGLVSFSSMQGLYKHSYNSSSLFALFSQACDAYVYIKTQEILQHCAASGGVR